MPKHYVGAKGNCDSLVAICGKAMSLPRDGVDVGGGIHVPPEMSRTTAYANPVLDAPGLTGWSIPLDDAEKFTPAELAKLTVPEKAQLDAALLVAVVLASAQEGDKS